MSQSTGTGTAHGVGGHISDKGMEAAIGVGRNGKRLNTNAADLQDELETVRDQFLELKSAYINNIRHDFMRNGLLGEIASRTPFFVYDLPELKRACSTAFVDQSGKMYICDTFARRLFKEHNEGKDSLNFLIRHEMDHLRRLHLTRMASFPHPVANKAQDIRINIDLAKGEAAERFVAQHSRECSGSALDDAVKAYLQELADTAVGTGFAMNFEDYKKYDGLSEEAIGALLMKDWKEPPRIPNREVSFEKIMEGAAQECDKVKVMVQQGARLPVTPPPYALTPAELSQLALDLRAIGKAKANPKKVSDADLQSAIDRLEKLREHSGLLELDLQHDKVVISLVGSGNTHSSGQTGDSYLDALKPSERVEAAIGVLANILNPQNGARKGEASGITVTDIERINQRQQDQDRDSVPHPNSVVDDHVMSTEELVDKLKNAGVDLSSLQKLGYDDLEKLPQEQQATKDGITAAINKASEDQMSLGARYPGGHLLNYAKAQMIDFFKPILTWELTYKQLLEAAGRGQRFEDMEPWSIYSADAADMGFKSQNDVPYMGSMVPGRSAKPLIVDVYDTSGSVDDAQLKRHISEGINMPGRMSRGTAPDVLHVFADTIARGEPKFIDAKNYKQVLAKGVDYGGRGGTNYQASLENVFELVRRNGGKRQPYAGREIAAIVYFGDCGDCPPDWPRLMRKAQECGVKKFPTIVFIAPRFTKNESFERGFNKVGQVVYYDAQPRAATSADNAVKQHVDLNAIGRSQEAKAKEVERAASARP